MNDGVEIYSNRVMGCVGRTENGGKYCKMGEHKTINCKLYPEIVWGVIDGEGPAALSFVDMTKTSPSCPASGNIQDDSWRQKVKRVKERLKRLEDPPGIIMPTCDTATRLEINFLICLMNTGNRE